MKPGRPLVMAALPCVLAACTTDKGSPSEALALESAAEPTATSAAFAVAMATEEPAACAVATLLPVPGAATTGTVRIVPQPHGVEVHVHLEHLPAGAHGFDIDAMGDCSPDGGATAGVHFNPELRPHGDRDERRRHAGDLGNLVADAAGIVDATFADEDIALSGPRSILGRAVSVRLAADDGVTQPDGGAGPRIACGRIARSEGEGP